LKKYNSLSPAIIAKVVIEKVQLSILAIAFSIFYPTDSLFYSLLAFKYYFVRKKCEKNREREREKRKWREKIIKNSL
jgi:uncharacterized oligopeptide transporter (OPT) family protein